MDSTGPDLGAEYVVERIRLAPDARLVESLGANHTFESAIADLVDNAVDAGAGIVSIHILTTHERVVEVAIYDDGCGMSSADIDRAMTVGHQRTYVEGDLGHFGMGLKAASFGHADVLTVWSSRSRETSVGRRIRRADFSKDFTCEVLSKDAADVMASRRMAVTGSWSGTTVVWSDIGNAYRGRSTEEARRWLATRSADVRAHLGAIFHRRIGDGRLRIDVLTDEVSEASGSGIPVLPIDPFCYPVSGHPDYPKRLSAKVDGQTFSFDCHIWPAKLDVTGFRIGQRSGNELQGFFIYRNDRLLQLGGWSEISVQDPSRQLARIVLEDSSAIGPLLRMNPEKNGLRFEPRFHDALNSARAADGTDFMAYLEDAQDTYIASRKRQRRRNPVVRPQKGLAPAVRRRIGQEVSFIEDEGMDIKWRPLSAGEFFDVDLRGRTLWLNSHYRPLFAPRGGSLNDAPILKAAMFLLTHHLFEGSHLGVRDKDQIEIWKAVLGAAAVAEAAMLDD